MSNKILSTEEITEKFLGMKNDLFRYCNKWALSDVQKEDLLSDVYMKALDNREKFKADTNFQAWFYTMTKNLFIDQYRSKVRHPKTEYDIETDTRKVINNADNIFVSDDIQLILNTLNEKDREIAKYLSQEFKYEEIAETMNIPIGTIKSRISHIRKVLSIKLNIYKNND